MFTRVGLSLYSQSWTFTQGNWNKSDLYNSLGFKNTKTSLMFNHSNKRNPLVYNMWCCVRSSNIREPKRCVWTEVQECWCESKLRTLQGPMSVLLTQALVDCSPWLREKNNRMHHRQNNNCRTNHRLCKNSPFSKETHARLCVNCVYH